MAAAIPAHAVEITGLQDFKALHGRYAPGGDCKRQPQVLVDASGMTFEVSGGKEKVSRMEFAASYGGNFYEGISQWFFPFGGNGNYPLLMTFNANEKEGAMTIEGQDEGWKGGPPFTARNRALVDGSPYARCR
ncbi:hypothetical protein CSC75_02500 [Pseudoxanthomonas wuyuanensis]|nr:hypothetical protein CSC75_02500 [Pseudoxanthomonas wuyuanensis]